VVSKLYFSTQVNKTTTKVKATLKQIAKELNVSVSVSKALNDSRN
jgi:Mn-dependent DtxR family transcriptional regulator